MNRFKLLLIALLAVQLCGATNKDVLIIGNKASEAKHTFVETNTEMYKGGMGETARKMLPPPTADYRGGTLTFRMKVDPRQQNYFTARFYGSETDNNLLMLFIEGKQVGFRHLGDVDYLLLNNGEKPFPNRFYYVTLPLPMSYTQGKSEVELGIRSFGPMWGYGETFDKYQKNMTESSVGIYKTYTHTHPCFEPDKTEARQGVLPKYQIRQTPGIEVLTELKERVNKELTHLLSKELLTSQLEMWTLAEAYSVTWTTAFQNQKVIVLLQRSIDDFYRRYQQQPNLVYQDPSVYNNEWLTVGPISRAIRMLWKELEPVITPQQRVQWTELMQAALAYSTTHRRHYTNQSMIIDLFLYDVNKALTLLAPLQALPEYQTLKYLYESIGLCPWTGINNACPLGNDYWQLTPKALTKELGFVGYYGEVLDWVVDIYRSTCVNSLPGTGDAQIRAQLLRMMEARSFFRYPAVDDQGNAVMRIEAVVGWRDGGHYPGDVTYGDRGVAWDATPLMTAALTFDARAIGMAQQMIRDNQFFYMVDKKMETKGMRATRSLLHIPDEYELIQKQPRSDFRMPMSSESPDFVFSDEEDGVVAVKNGDEILYASLYWRARNAVNNLAKVHYTTPLTDRISNVCIETVIDDSGMCYTRPDWVNLGFAGWREWYKDVHSAHAGEELKIARIPAGIKFKPGDENVYAGKALYYRLNYGKYIIAMNSSDDQTFELPLPPGKKSTLNLTNGRQPVSDAVIKVAPQSTVVLYRE